MDEEAEVTIAAQLLASRHLIIMLMAFLVSRDVLTIEDKLPRYDPLMGCRRLSTLILGCLLRRRKRCEMSLGSSRRRSRRPLRHHPLGGGRRANISSPFRARPIR